MKIFVSLLGLLLASPSAFAFLPPAYYIYSKLAEQKTKLPVTGVTVTVSRPQSGGTEEILGSVNIQDWQPTPGGWPGLSLLFHQDADSIVRAVSAFGLEVLPETELMRVEKSRLATMKEPPDPFYRPDPNMALKRARQTYAWVHRNTATGLSVWVEKDTILPLKIAAPCPAPAASLSWAKAGDNKCELEFRNLYALRRGNFQSTRMILWKDGNPLLFLTFDHLAAGRSKLPALESKLAPEVKELVETILH